MKTNFKTIRVSLLALSLLSFATCQNNTSDKNAALNFTPSCNSRPAEPAGSVCNTQNCLLEFEGYSWWTNYSFNISNSGYWFNGQQWDPRLAFVDSAGLHLQMKRTYLPNAPDTAWSSIEVVLWGKSGGARGDSIPSRFYPGYGTYLVAIETSPNFNHISNNCCFGAFTYMFENDSTQTNSHHEIDMVEISRWGNFSDPTNAQFTLQPWEPNGNVHRITLKDDGKITLVMNWPGAGTPVTYNVYYGLYNFNNLPKAPDITWTTSESQNQYIPTQACQTVHFNLWRQPPNTVTPNGNQEVIIKKFNYKPLSSM